MDNSESKLIGRIIFTGTLESCSPIVIGKGKGEETDVIEVIKGYKNDFFIPSPSFAGALRHYFKKNYEISDDLNEFLFGGVKYQSSSIFDDILPTSPVSITLRDGIKIGKSGIAEDKAKFEYEAADGAINFQFFGEVSIREAFKGREKDILGVIATMRKDMVEGEISVGAKTTKGFGRMKLSDFKAYYFEFPKDGESYIKFSQLGLLDGNFEIGFSGISPLARKERTDFLIQGIFSLKSSMLIASGSAGSYDIDKAHIKSNEKPVIPGTSIKGAVRDRAIKIINTLRGNATGDELVRKTFGWADNDSGSGKKEKIKSRLIIDESLIENAVEQKQTRIKIDRFTGGPISGALLRELPVWHDGEKIIISMKIEKYEPWEAGLMLLILKDLWNGDLPIGGEKSIGRGLLSGEEAVITSEKGCSRIYKENDQIRFDGKDTLNGYIEAFRSKMQEGAGK